MKISTTALWHNKNKLYWLPVFGTTQSSVWVEWGAWLLEIVVRRRTQHAPDECHESVCEHKFTPVTNTLEVCILCGIRR